MAKSSQERSAKASKKRSSANEEELRLRVRPGTKQALKEIMEWHGITELGEAMTLMIHRMHELGQKASAEMFEPPRHVFEPSETLRLRFENESRKCIANDPGDEIISPKTFPHGEQQCTRAQLSIFE